MKARERAVERAKFLEAIPVALTDSGLEKHRAEVREMFFSNPLLEAPQGLPGDVTEAFEMLAREGEGMLGQSDVSSVMAAAWLYADMMDCHARARAATDDKDRAMWKQLATKAANGFRSERTKLALQTNTKHRMIMDMEKMAAQLYKDRKFFIQEQADEDVIPDDLDELLE